MSSDRINRRTVLRGIGAGLGLPLLEVMQPANALGQTVPQPPLRTAFIFFPNGVILDPWRPVGEGHDFEFGATMESLQPFHDDLIIFTGLAQHHARPNGDGAGDHARNAGAYLTGAQPRKTSGADISVGQSIDQAIAGSIGRATRLPSLELGIERGRGAGSCDSGYSCAYSENISWRTATTPMAKEVHPRLAFNRLFGIRENSQDQKQRDAGRASILDFVSGDAKRLMKTVSGSDRAKLDEYFNSVREIEQRIEHAANFVPPDVPEIELPDDLPGEFQLHVRIMYELQLLAFQTDSTRITSFMLGRAGSNRTFPEVDVRDGHHGLTHHQNDQEKIEQIKRIDKYQVEQFAWFLERMKSVTEGDSTLLDNCMILYGSAISDGNRHNHDDLPVILAGKGAGSIESGRHIKLETETPLNNLFLSLSQRMGAGIDEIGDSTAVLPLS
ncbi:MAG: DUF1552 domain-containing protein [Fuerstiella sp.]|nr:DUF1552 domain-containing protein [Fuerstiella sp.]